MQSPSPLIVLCLLILANALQVLGNGTNRTLDDCQSHADCGSGLRCFLLAPSGIRRCQNDGRATCKCLPRNKDPIFCGKDPKMACPSGEGCGRSKATQNEICLSCNVLETDDNWDIINAEQCGGSLTPAPTPSKSPAPRDERNNYELCNMNSKCLKGSKCKESKSLLCIFTDPLCKCLPSGDASCKANNDCRSGQVCAQESRTGKTLCVGCDAAVNDIFFNADSVSSCGNAQPPPKYPPASNGFFHDVCFDNNDCSGSYICTNNESGKPCDFTNSLFCFCRFSDKKRNLETCAKSNECPKGETCAQSEVWDIKRCISDSFIGQFTSNEVTTFGKNRKTRGASGNVGDSCTYNYDCVDDLACTHREDGDRYGGCLGREGCQCTPRMLQKCGSNADCRAGETCVNYAGAKNKPFCFSTKAFGTDFHQVVLKAVGVNKDNDGDHDVEELKRTDLLAWKPCRQSSQCNSGKCVHYAESLAQECDGRRTCFCRQDRKCSKGKCGEGETCVRLTGSSGVKGECMALSTYSDLHFDEIYEEV